MAGWRLSSPAGVAPIGPVLACGNGLAAYADAFSGRSFMAGADAGIMPHAAQIAVLARLAVARGDTLEASAAQPVYLRNKVALTTAERMAGKAA